VTNHEPPAPGWWQASDAGWHPPPGPGEGASTADSTITATAEAPPPVPALAETRTGSRWRWIALGVVVIACTAGAVVLALDAGGESTEDAFLADLEDAGLSGEFAADRQALSFARGVCNDLDDGGEPEGTEVAQLAVEHLCPDYADSFEVLEVADIEGTFTLIDFDTASTGCLRGDGGYGDINSSTQVVLRNDDGDTLGRTSLGAGDPTGVSCLWRWTIDDVSEGEDAYILEVGDRGEISYTWDELKAGPQTSLG
jgi:hypothetical protein